MRIGFDCDGVLANFIPVYQKLVVATTGRDTFQTGDDVDPPVWLWPEMRGYTPEEMKKVWGKIIQDDTFWLNLPPMEDNVDTLRTLIKELERCHDVYYITSRPGLRAKRQTEIWLMEHLAYHMRVPGAMPTVLITSDKGDACRVLKLDAYIDDNFDNICDVVKKANWPDRDGRRLHTTTYMLNRRYNTAFDWTPTAGPVYTRVDSLGQMFDKEIAAGRL